MFKESNLSEEKCFSKEQAISFILNNVPGYTEADFDIPVGDKQATLHEFLNSRKNGSEWTDPHGFRIDIIGSEFKIFKEI